MAMAIIALIPNYNELAHVADVVRRTLAYLPAVVVDDGSSDGSGQAAAEAGATVLTHSVNRGKGAALATGITWALGHGYEALIMLDADAQHDPDEIPKFLDAYRRDVADIVLGERDFSRMPRSNRFGNSNGSRLLSWALRRPITDNQCGYRLLNRKAMETLRFTSSGFEFEVEMIVQAVIAGLRLAWLPIRTIYVAERRSHFRPIADSVEFLKVIWSARRRVSRALAERQGRPA